MLDEKKLEQVVYEIYREDLARIPSQEQLEKSFSIPPRSRQQLDLLLRSHKWQSRLLVLTKKVAAFAILLVGSFLLLFALNGNVRATCFRWIRMATSDGMTYYRTAPSSDSGKITGFRLEYLPDGYVQQNMTVNEKGGTALYRQKDSVIFFQYMPAEDTDLMVDHEYSLLFSKTLSDGTECDFYCHNNGSERKLIWKKGMLVCILYISELNEDELFRIANNIRLISQRD